MTNPVEDAVRQCYATWSEGYYDEYYGAAAAYPPVHRSIIHEQLKDAKPRTVLDAGCGPASMLRELVDRAMELYGFDLTAEMVTEARRVLAGSVAVDRLWQGSVLDADAFVAPDGTAHFDAALCVGVLPHVPREADEVVLRHLHGALVPGGLALVEARNELFSLFTLNRYTFEFFRDVLIGVDPDAEPGLGAALDELASVVRLDEPPVRRGAEDAPGYDEVLSRLHNPLRLRMQMETIGFCDVETLFYHYHAVPPIVARHLPDGARASSLAREDPRDWRGHFMASAFVLRGRRR